MLSAKKPGKLADLVGNPSAAAAVRQWAGEWAGGKTPPPLLIYGPPGTGKTALAHAAASEFGWEIFEFNASDFRSEESVIRLLSSAVVSGTIWGGIRLILIDDADSLSGTGDRGGASAIARAVSMAKQPIILTARDLYDRKLQPFRSLCAPVPVQRVAATTIMAFLKKTALENGLRIPDESIGKIAKFASGDVRAALNDLQGGNCGASRDSEKGAFETVSAILKATDYASARRAAASSEANHDLLKLWVAHNLPLEYERPFDLAEGYAALSRSDVFDGRISRAQYWGYLRYSSDLLSAGVAVAKQAPYRKFTRFGFPDYLREMGATKSSRALRKRALWKIASACHCSISHAAGYLPSLWLLAGESQGGAIAKFGFDEDEAAFVFKSAPKNEKAPSSGAKAASRKGRGRKTA